MSTETDRKPTAIMRLTNEETGECADVYLPMSVQSIGDIAEGMGDEWVCRMLPSDAPRPAVLTAGQKRNSGGAA